MFIFTWGDRLVVLLVTVACAAAGAGLGWLIAGKVGAIVGALLLFPVAQAVLVKLLPKRYAQRSTPRS